MGEIPLDTLSRPPHVPMVLPTVVSMGYQKNPFAFRCMGFVLGAIASFLEPFCGHLSPKIDKVSEELTLRYPHEEPCVVGVGACFADELLALDHFECWFEAWRV